MNKLTKKDFERFCSAHSCGGCNYSDPRPRCPLHSQNYGDNPTCGRTIVFSMMNRPYLRATAENIDEIANTYNVVSEWIITHPEEHKKTRQSELLKMFPNMTVDSNGVIDTCPEEMDSMLNMDCRKSCAECRRNYWLTEIE